MNNKTLFLIFCFYSSLAFSNTSYHVTGKVLSTGQCVKKTQLFVAQEDVLLYQLEVPVNGAFEIKFLPGKYSFLATNQEGCEGHAIVKVDKI